LLFLFFICFWLIRKWTSGHVPFFYFSLCFPVVVTHHLPFVPITRTHHYHHHYHHVCEIIPHLLSCQTCQLDCFMQHRSISVYFIFFPFAFHINVNHGFPLLLSMSRSCNLPNSHVISSHHHSFTSLRVPLPSLTVLCSLRPADTWARRTWGAPPSGCVPAWAWPWWPCWAWPSAESCWSHGDATPHRRPLTNGELKKKNKRRRTGFISEFLMKSKMSEVRHFHFRAASTIAFVLI